MTWNIVPECTALVFLSIIWVYSRKGSMLPSLKNKLFQYCFLITFIAIFFNILSTVMIHDLTLCPLWITWMVTTIYFIFTPLMGMVYFFYAAAVIYEGGKQAWSVIGWSSIPGIGYAIMLILNLMTHNLFNISTANGYTRGGAVIVTYIVFYAYCIASMVMAWLKRKWLEPSVCHILLSFPVIALLVIIFQQRFSDIILTGSAATCALLIIYLHLQNKRISIDYLTGLPNRTELLNMIKMLMHQEPQHSFSVMVLSLRDFKQINDTYGQQNGDAFLKVISNYLIAAAKPHQIYRFNGDEFAILFRNGGDEAIRSILTTIRERMRKPWEVREYSCIIPGVIGIARYPDSAQNFESLVNCIEYAIAKAKNEKQDSVCYCDQKMLGEIQRKTQIIRILREKCANNSFEIYYQPIYCVTEKHFCFAESLMRINDTPIGPIYPNEFIPVAEETGIIVELTYQILDRVCKFVNRLLSQGLDIDGIHVNFSAVQFNQKDLLERVCEIITSNKTPFAKIKIEFTESALAENSEIVSHFALEMHKRGLRLGLDDFGTGYSNLDSVLKVPFGTIKLDKSLIWSAVENERSDIMVTNICSIFHKMGMKVLAEGVENEEQNTFVISRGMELIQGYLYARPLPEEEAERFWQTHKRPVNDSADIKNNI